jgi:hypothetical protein
LAENHPIELLPRTDKARLLAICEPAVGAQTAHI